MSDRNGGQINKKVRNKKSLPHPTTIIVSYEIHAHLLAVCQSACEYTLPHSPPPPPLRCLNAHACLSSKTFSPTTPTACRVLQRYSVAHCPSRGYSKLSPITYITRPPPANKYRTSLKTLKHHQRDFKPISPEPPMARLRPSHAQDESLHSNYSYL